MVPYNREKQPSISQWTGGNMNAVVILDQGGNISYTNLDEISGKVVVRCGKKADISSIVVKLEGESRTRLMSPGGGPNRERPRPELEYHKILYKVQTVFPSADIIDGRSQMSAKAAFTLAPGQHEYPFKFKLPFNNSCASDKSQMPVMSFSGTGLEIAKPPPRHVKRTLPPTLSGFPGEAEIRYFVKATVNRHSMFKENPRAYTPFNFFPIEPPRPASTGSEIYARQKHNFNAFHEEPMKSKIKGIFGRKDPTTVVVGEAPFVSVDARLPEPPILTCNHEIPLRLLVKKLNAHSEPVYLQSLQISLIGSTMIRAQNVYREENNSWVIMSKTNMGIRIGLPEDPINTETVIDDRMWRGQPLPNTVAPSFQTCNISRSYQLDVRVGLSYSGSVQNASKPQSIVLPLRLETHVYSGIKPPPELIQAMAEARERMHQPPVPDPTSEKQRMEYRRDSEFGTNQVPPTPTSEPGPSTFNNASARPGNMQESPIYSDAPPSYEDAIASNIRPLDAPRPTYEPPPAGEDDILRRNEKQGWMS